MPPGSGHASECLQIAEKLDSISGASGLSLVFFFFFAIGRETGRAILNGVRYRNRPGSECTAARCASVRGGCDCDSGARGAVRGMAVAKGRGKTRRKSEARRREKSEFPLHQTAPLDRISLANRLSYTRVVFSEGLERQEKGYFHKPFTNFFL